MRKKKFTNMHVIFKKITIVWTVINLFQTLVYAQINDSLLTPQQMKADVALIKSVWENIHPGLYRYNSKAQIDSYFKTLNERINTSLSRRQFFIILSQLNTQLRCGHSYVNYYNNKKVIRNSLYASVYLPFLFSVVDNKFVVTHNLSEIEAVKPGYEITAINGISTRTILDSLLSVSKADGRNGLNKQLDNITIKPSDIHPDKYCLFDIYFPLFFKPDINEKKYAITFKPTKGKAFTIETNGLSKEERYKICNTRYGEAPQNEKSWYLKPVNNQSILFRLGDFSTYNWQFDFNKYLDSVFNHINSKGFQNLIVDIRQNEGGADEARDAVLSYLTSKPLGCANVVRRLYRYQTIPDSLLPYLNSWDDRYKKPKSDTDFYRTTDGFVESRNPQKNCVEIKPQINHFKGKVFLMTDVTNSSATFIMADVFKRHNLGKIIGEKTGGTQQGINGGEIVFFYLPNSLIEMDVPLIYQAPLTIKPDAGISPDFEVKTTISDITKQRDAQLDFTLKMIKKPNKHYKP